MKKEFRFDLEKTKEHLNKIFPDEKVREVYLKSISECAKIAAKENNTNWNVNLSNDFIRVNCGARYIFSMKAENIRVMCWRDSFLKLDRNFINDFLDNVFFYKEDTKELLSSSYNPKTYEDLVSIPANILWHNSLQFNIAPRLWAEKYAEKLMPSVLDFCKDCIKHSSIMTQMQQAHSTGLIELINEEMKMNLVQPQYSNKYKSNLQGDTQMAQEDTLVKKYANLLKNTKNLILTGAPGTGKTYLAKTIAARLILDREINDFDKDLSEEEKKQVKSQTGFVQFHPSYDYTDFVEGLRPKQSDNSDQIGFERKDGVFKDFCARALKESYRENNENVDNFEECWERLVEELNENNYIDISLLSGKGNLKVELNEYGTGLANRTYENDDYQEGNWISGKSKFFSKDQLYNIYQGLPGVPAGGHDNYRKAIVEYMKKNLGLLDYKKTESTQKTKKNFVFIIDEINRGEVAKIFGELFYCVDPGYRGKEGKINTQYQNLIKENNIFYSGFFIPENVYIIGTMNDIDRSVESMDFAFRCRFTWAEVKAEDTQYMLDAELDAVLADEAKRRMKNLNNAISEIGGLNEAYHIGASYFLKLKNYGGDFESLWEYHIKGILQEYLRGNPNGKLDDLKAAYDREEKNKDGE